MGRRLVIGFRLSAQAAIHFKGPLLIQQSPGESQSRAISMATKLLATAIRILYAMQI